MEFNSARTIEDVVWSMRLAEQPRASNRALIDSIFNGAPPYSETEAEQNRIVTNVNDLSSNRIFHDVTRQFSNGFLRSDEYFRVELDYGPAHKREEWSQVITKEINKRMKRSLRYRQTLRNVFAQLILHGVGPVVWSDKMKWCPSMQMMCDVLIPSQTLLTMENLPYFAVYRRYTAAELVRLTSGPKIDKGWNMPAVEKSIAWARKQTGTTQTAMDQNWTPERIAEDIKSNSAFWSSDAAPTVNCWDCYFLSENKKEFGWKRRIIFDCPASSEVGSEDATITATTKSVIDTRGEFLYSAGDRLYAHDLQQIIHFQFADGSVVAPYRYHSVRSLGFLLYALCHLHNRLRCKVMDSTFENLLNYIRVQNPDDAERLKKVDLINLGFLPEGYNFVTQQERWQVNQNLIQMVLNMNQRDMSDSSPSFNQDSGQGQNDQIEKTATQITAEINKASSTIGTIMNEAYEYQTPQYREIGRRFCMPNSSDIDVQKFRAACFRQGLPKEALDVDCWNISPDRVMGNGNKQLEIAQAQLLMSVYDKLDPDAQRFTLRKFAYAVVDNPSDVRKIAPEQRDTATDSVHDAELASAVLLMSLPMNLKQGVNHGEYAATLLGAMSVEMQKVQQRGATPDDINGLQNLAGQSLDGQPTSPNGAFGHIQIVAQNKDSQQEAKQLGDAMGKLMNNLKALNQQMQQAQQQQQPGSQLDPETAVKLKGQLVLAETKAANSKAANEQKLQQKQQSHDQKLAQKAESAKIADIDTLTRARTDAGALDLKTAAEIRREGVKAAAEPGDTGTE
jgi:hypothetical protein